MRQHDRERPYAPENGHPLAFAPGDRVTFVNDYGVRNGYGTSFSGYPMHFSNSDARALENISFLFPAVFPYMSDGKVRIY